MSITHTLGSTWSRSTGESIQKTLNVTSEGEINIDVDIPNASTDLEVAIILTLTLMKSVFIVSDKDVTLETNSGASPGNTFSLKADLPMSWASVSGLPNPFTVNVTKFFFTNASGSVAAIKIRALVDSTP